MNQSRFDTISRLFAKRESLAQDATPGAVITSDTTDPHASADEVTPKPELLFVQSFTSGAWKPKEQEDGVYTLTLTGTAASTIYFSDRPDRIFGQMPTTDFLERLGFTPANPPNAALVTQGENGSDQEVLVIELLNPTYDGETLSYDARVLADYDESSLAHAAVQQQDYKLSETFSEGGLFIDGLDDCSPVDGYCYSETDGEKVIVGYMDIPRCGEDVVYCNVCNSDPTSGYYGARCADAFPDQCNYGFNSDLQGTFWDCFAHLT